MESRQKSCPVPDFVSRLATSSPSNFEPKVSQFKDLYSSPINVKTRKQLKTPVSQ